MKPNCVLTFFIVLNCRSENYYCTNASKHKIYNLDSFILQFTIYFVLPKTYLKKNVQVISIALQISSVQDKILYIYADLERIKRADYSLEITELREFYAYFLFI